MWKARWLEKHSNRSGATLTQEDELHDPYTANCWWSSEVVIICLVSEEAGFLRLLVWELDSVPNLLREIKNVFKDFIKVIVSQLN